MTLSAKKIYYWHYLQLMNNINYLSIHLLTYALINNHAFGPAAVSMNSQKVRTTRVFMRCTGCVEQSATVAI